MINLLKFAAIDIGSNAIRLLFSNIIESGTTSEIRKSSIIRMPVRLGDSVFKNGFIPEEKIKNLIHSLIAFKHLMQVENVIQFRACATSAMREAKNGREVLDRIYKESGIQVEIIDGKEEARIILQNDLLKNLKSFVNFLFVDVGGGSTEISLFSNKKALLSYSFKVGTIRLLNKLVKESQKDEMKACLQKLASEYQIDALIGTGGNINKYFKLSRKKEGKPLSYYHLMELHDQISDMDYFSRIKTLSLNPDRADVIIPAGKLFLDIMKWTGLKQIYVPKKGLADGMIAELYSEYHNNSSS